MPFLPKMPTPPQQVFHLATPAHMLAKLRWEIHQFKQSLDNTELLWRNTNIAYSAFNTAVTAWHCGDWAWRAAGVESRNGLSERFAFKLVQDEQKDLNAFLNAVAADCRALHICRQIANGSKHMGADRGDPAIGAQVIWTYDESGTPAQFVMRDGPDIIPAEHVFESAFDYWARLFGDIGYVEGRFVGPD